MPLPPLPADTVEDEEEEEAGANDDAVGTADSKSQNLSIRPLHFNCSKIKLSISFKYLAVISTQSIACSCTVARALRTDLALCSLSDAIDSNTLFPRHKNGGSVEWRIK
jgi:hypothetical protein